MRLVSARAAGLAAAVVCGAALLGLSPAHATPVSQGAVYGTIPGGNPIHIISGSVTINLTVGGPVVVPGASLGGNAYDTGVLASDIASLNGIVNNTNVSIVLSVGHTVVPPGGTVNVGPLLTGDLFISVLGGGTNPYPW